MIIYKFTNIINGKVYIGQTSKTLDERIKGHLSKVKGGSTTHIHNAIRKYGWNNFRAEIIDDTADCEDELDRLEKYYIAQYDSINVGYNLAPGGEDNCMDSDKVKQKHDFIMRTPEVRSKISASMKKRIAEHGISEEHRKHVSEGLRRFYDSGKRPNYKHPQHLSPEHYKALNDAKNKSVYCVDLDGNVVAEFKRVKDAADWWYNQGYIVSLKRTICATIKKSYEQDRYIRGLKWIYRV